MGFYFHYEYSYLRGINMNENDIKEATEAEKVACEVCLNNIPATEAKSEEATDYFV